MAAVTTKKPGGDHAVQLTFPAVFAANYAHSGLTPSFYPTANSRPTEFWRSPVGESGTQDLYHDEKRKDAVRMALAGVAATRASQRHLALYPSNYNVPKPVLSQRKFANPSMGNFSDIYSGRHVAALDGAGASGGDLERLVGGVVRTATGQQWVTRALQARVRDLDLISSGTVQFTEYKAPANAATATEAKVEQGVAEPLDVKLYLDLQAQISDIVGKLETSSPAKIKVVELFNMLKLLFRVGATSTAAELNELLDTVESILVPLRTDLADMTKIISGKQSKLIYIIMQKASEYIKTMLTYVNKPADARIEASRAEVRRLKFTALANTKLEDFLSTKTGEKLILDLEKQRAADIKSGALAGPEEVAKHQAAVDAANERRGTPLEPFAPVAPNRKKPVTEGRYHELVEEKEAIDAATSRDKGIVRRAKANGVTYDQQKVADSLEILAKGEDLPDWLLPTQKEFNALNRKWAKINKTALATSRASGRGLEEVLDDLMEERAAKAGVDVDDDEALDRFDDKEKLEQKIIEKPQWRRSAKDIVGELPDRSGFLRLKKKWDAIEKAEQAAFETGVYSSIEQAREKLRDKRAQREGVNLGSPGAMREFEDDEERERNIVENGRWRGSGARATVPAILSGHGLPPVLARASRPARSTVRLDVDQREVFARNGSGWYGEAPRASADTSMATTGRRVLKSAEMPEAAPAAIEPYPTGSGRRRRD